MLDSTSSLDHAPLSSLPEANQETSLLVADLDEPSSPSSVPPALQRVGLLRMFALTCFSYSYGMLLGTYALVTLPIESKAMAPTNDAMVFAFLLGLAGAAQLASPTAGFFSDRAKSPWGKRRPFIVSGSVVGVVGLIVQYSYSMTNLPMYSIAFFFSNLALNVISTSAYGLIPDMIPEQQAGQANGLSTLWGVLGNCSGFLYYFVTGNVSGMYFLYIASVTVTCAVTCLVAKEAPTSKPPVLANGSAAPRLSWSYFEWSDLAKSYWVSPSEHWDFFLVLIGRTCFYIGVSVNAFLQFYYRDMINLPSEGSLSDPGKATCVMAFIGQGFGVLSAFPAGHLSDKFGRKPLILLGTIGIGIGYLALLFVDEAGQTFMIAGFLGISNGIYQAVDLALALDTLPSKNDAARYLGVWGVGSFVGACVGPAIGAPLLSYFGATNDPENDGYSKEGYIALMTFGVATLFLGTVILLFVRSAR